VLAVRPEEFDQLEDAIDNQAEPQVHERSGVHVERAVARARGQIRHEAEIEQVAYQDNGQVFEPVLCIEKFIFACHVVALSVFGFRKIATNARAHPGRESSPMFSTVPQERRGVW